MSAASYQKTRTKSAIVVSSRAFLCTFVHGVSVGFLVGDNNSRLLIQFRQRTKLPVEALPANDPKAGPRLVI